ncbi:MAG: nitrogenase component 1 [Lentisphaerota bacterium]
MSNDYFKQTVAPRRESRLKAGIAYGGNVCQFAGSFGCDGKRKDGFRPCMERNERGFSQGSICLLLPALGTIGTLPDTAVLLHGAVGCGSSMHAVACNVRSGANARWGKPGDASWMSTAMNEVDVITGGEAKLARAIEEIDATRHPSTIIVVSGCIPGITGDDVEAVIANVQERVKAKVLPVHCEGFKTKIWATAYDAYYHAFGRHLFEKPDDAPELTGEERSMSVNLLNVSSMGRIDEAELERLLKMFGLKVNIFPVFAKPQDIWKVTRAALSISTCPTHDDYLLTHLQEKYNIPYVLRHMPIGIENTGVWLREIGKAVGKEHEVDIIIKHEERVLRKALEPFLPFFKGKRIFLSAGEYRTLATANLLVELGFEIAALRPFHHDEFAEVEYSKLVAHSKDFTLNIANCQPFEEANLLKKLKPDLFMGHLVGNSTASKLGIPTHTIYNIGLNYVGYKGVFELARRLYRHLRNPNFHRTLSVHAKLPYFDSWYAEDAFKFIKTAPEQEE